MRSHRFTAALVALTAVVASCGSSHTSGKVKETATTAPATTTTASATTTTASPEAAVLAAYRASWDDFLSVGAHPDPLDPRLADHATGAELEQLRRAMQKFRDEGVVERGTIDLRPRVAALTATTATVRDCSLSHIADVDAKTGQVRNADPPVWVPSETTLAVEAGVWKVSHDHEGNPGCTSA